MTRLTRDESRAVTRRRLLDAAAEVFAEKGFYGASLDDIADRAGFSRGAVYSNFADKDQLFLALFDERTDSGIREVADLLEAAPSADGFIQGLIARQSARSGSPRPWFLLESEFRLYAVRNRKVRPRLAKRLEAERAAIGQAVAALLGEMKIQPPMPVEQLASIVMAIEDGLGIQRSVDANAIPPTMFYDTLGLLLRALGTMQATPPRSSEA